MNIEKSYERGGTEWKELCCLHIFFHEEEGGGGGGRFPFSGETLSHNSEFLT